MNEGGDTGQREVFLRINLEDGVSGFFTDVDDGIADFEIGSELNGWFCGHGFLAVGIEAFEKFLLGLWRGGEAEEGEFSGFLDDANGGAFFDVVHEAGAVLEGNLDVSERMLWVLEVPFLIVPRADQVTCLVIPAWADGFKKEAVTISAMTSQNADGGVFSERNPDCGESSGKIGIRCFQ